MAGVALAILAPIAAMLVQLAVSRSREFLADRSGARRCRKPLALARALAKLQARSLNSPLQGAQPATPHLSIVGPLSGRGLLQRFSTHPPVEERIARLRALAQEGRGDRGRAEQGRSAPAAVGPQPRGHSMMGGVLPVRCGALLLHVGAGGFVGGASGLARSWGVAPAVIGFTVVGPSARARRNAW